MEKAMAKELTEKQRVVLSTLKNYWTTFHVPPSISDVAKKLGINKATAYEHLLALKKKGYLVHQPKAGRTWRSVDQKQPKTCDHPQIPILGRVAAGTPVLATQNIEGHVITESSRPVQDLFALRIQGDSMINAHIKNNDIVIASKSASTANKDIVVALIDGEEATVKRLERKSQLLRLLPENDAYEPLELDHTRVHILGKVIEVRRSIA
jgi:repressor LexA